MKKATCKGWNPGKKAPLLNLSQAGIRFCNEFVRLPFQDRVRVMRYLMDRAYYIEFGLRPIEAYLPICYVQLQRKSQTLAKAWKRWLSELLRTKPDQFACSKAIVGLWKALDCLKFAE